MMNIIKTAIITIIISVVSGLLLEYCKNLAPRILCIVGNGVPIKKNGKKIYAYIINVRNLSNKIVHELTLNIQSLQGNLKITDTNITDGLKFDSSIEDNTIDIQIPFLNKDDEFSATVYVENQYGLYDKPTVVIRSPEKFKEVDSAGQSGILSSLFNKDTNQVNPKSNRKTRTVVPDKKDDFTMVMDRSEIAQKTINKRSREVPHKNRKVNNSKKAIIIVASIVLFIAAGVFVKSYFKNNFNNTQAPAVENTVPEQSAGTTGPTKGTTRNKTLKSSTKGTTENSGSKASTGETTGNTGSKSPSGETTGNTSSKTSSGETTGNSDTKSPTGGSTGNSGSKSSSGETTGNPGSKTSTNGTTGNTTSKTPTGNAGN